MSGIRSNDTKIFPRKVSLKANKVVLVAIKSSLQSRERKEKEMGSHFPPLNRSSYSSHSQRRTLEKESDYLQSTARKMKVFEMGLDQPPFETCEVRIILTSPPVLLFVSRFVGFDL